MLPRSCTKNATGQRCCALDQNGKRCRRTKDLQPRRYHGSDELYGFLTDNKEPGWVLVDLCPAHREDKPKHQRRTRA